MDIGTAKLVEDFDAQKANYKKYPVYLLGRVINCQDDFGEAVGGLFYFSYRQFSAPLTQGNLTQYQDTSRLY